MLTLARYKKSSTLRAKLEWLGVEPSYSRPRVSNDNSISEALFRTRKYRPEYPHDGFKSIDAARLWRHQFVCWYNEEHKHSAIKFVTPGQRHRGEDVQMLKEREKLYKKERSANPSHWSGNTRDWSRSECATLNADKTVDDLKKAA